MTSNHWNILTVAVALNHSDSHGVGSVTKRGRDGLLIATKEQQVCLQGGSNQNTPNRNGEYFSISLRFGFLQDGFV